MNTQSISRRRFAQLLGAGAACLAAKPELSLARSPSPTGAPPATGLVRLGSNENSVGPSAKALKAITDSFDVACRYPYQHAEMLTEAVARHHGVAPNQVLLGAGSSEILMLCAAAFTAPGTLVVADPTFEAIAGHASRRGAEVLKVPLTPTYAHDLSRMRSSEAGLVYICNPNNPTASITPKAELREFLKSAASTTALLVDEAYHEYVESSDYESVIPLIKDHPKLIVARTFSKIYGMAGVRCGYCIAQPSIIEQLRRHQSAHTVSVLALVAAMASLDDADHVTTSRRSILRTRASVSTELESMGFKSIPSHANFLMVDMQRPVGPLIQAMKERKVQVGRVFPTLPNHMRVTIGQEAEMRAFLAALRQVIA
jgi:histidinol-phosphate aminotransferase